MQIYELFRRKQNHKMKFIESVHKNIRRLTFTIRPSNRNQKSKDNCNCLMPLTFSSESYSESG